MQTINERFSYAIGLISQKKTDVAKVIGVSDAAISKICSGKANPSNQTIKSFCDNYGIDREWLETGKGDPIRQQSRQEQLSAAFTRALAGTSVSANLISSIALALDRLDDDHAAVILDVLTEIVKGYGNLEVVDQPKQKNTAAARSGDRMEAADLTKEEEDAVLPPPYTGDI